MLHDRCGGSRWRSKVSPTRLSREAGRSARGRSSRGKRWTSQLTLSNCRRIQPARSARPLCCSARSTGDRVQMGVSDLARSTNLSKSTTFRLLSLLVDGGLVDRVGTDYRIGQRILEMARTVAPSPYAELRDVAMPHLLDLLTVTKETVHLAVPTGDRILYIEKIFGHNQVSSPSRRGRDPARFVLGARQGHLRVQHRGRRAPGGLDDPTTHPVLHRCTVGAPRRVAQRTPGGSRLRQGGGAARSDLRCGSGSRRVRVAGNRGGVDLGAEEPVQPRALCADDPGDSRPYLAVLRSASARRADRSPAGLAVGRTHLPDTTACQSTCHSTQRYWSTRGDTWQHGV